MPIKYLSILSFLCTQSKKARSFLFTSDSIMPKKLRIKQRNLFCSFLHTPYIKQCSHNNNFFSQNIKLYLGILLPTQLHGNSFLHSRCNLPGAKFISEFFDPNHVLSYLIILNYLSLQHFSINYSIIFGI